jgi:selenocysteine-specific elongation factor
MRVIGTAGHVDHGKSTLVRALSGIDPDRLKEEKQRGMTIDLGFAWMELPAAPGNDAPLNNPESVGIVDVPGHLDFIKNMLAGVGGIDLVLLVIAADEGVMPQTREHLAIIDLLAVPTGMVVLTKCDLVDDPMWLDLVELDVAELLEGTRLAGAPIVRVSATTGEGLDALRVELATRLADLPLRRDRARPRLGVDRTFSLSGFGTVVTGTLLDGALAVGDSVELLPQGLVARVRGLQTHKQSVVKGRPGSRLAINLGGIDATDVRRGDVVAHPNTLRPTLLLDAQAHLLADAHGPLKHNAPVDFFSGASEIPARVRILGAEMIEPGGTGWVQLRLARPAVVVAGDHYILRTPSPSATIGGGVVVNAQPGRRWRRHDPAVLKRLEALVRGAPDELLLDLLGRTPLLTPRQLVEQSGLDAAAADDALAQLEADGAVVRLQAGGDEVLLTLDSWHRIAAALTAMLETFHAQNPLRAGMPRSEVRSRLQRAAGGAPLSPRLLNALLTYAAAAAIAQESDALVWRMGFAPTLTTAQEAAVARLLATFAAAPAAPPNPGDALALLDGDETLFEMLLEQGQLLRLGGDVLFRPQDVEALTASVRAYLEKNGSITLAQARDLLGTSRKYVQALLEEMDARRMTRREGDLRVLR